MPPKKYVGTRRQEMAKKADNLSKMKSCHFSKQEIERLLQLFKEFTKKIPSEIKQRGKGIDRFRFRDILHQQFNMTDDVLMDNVFKAFDKDSDGFVSDEEWVLGMSTFMKGTLEEQAKFCFAVYSVRGGNAYITRDEMIMLLKHAFVQMPIEEDPDENLKDLVEMTLKRMDKDHDGRLSVEDYTLAVAEDKLLLEALGPCLPGPVCSERFLALIADDKRKH